MGCKRCHKGARTQLVTEVEVETPWSPGGPMDGSLDPRAYVKAIDLPYCAECLVALLERLEGD